ncbi:MAG: bifunctional DNA primase/polymerase [Desulfobacterales bacterium]|nr:bifunctional DNA primase/polymerase [Desulfobacterales bacterium]
MNNKQAALDYIGKGLKVIPLWSPSLIRRKPPGYFVDELNMRLENNKREEKPLSEDQVYENLFIEVCKRPKIKWKQYQERIPTVQEVSEWFDKWPDANIAVVTGKESGVVVFDLDSERAVEYAENEGGFPDTPKVKSGKGYHYFMQCPDFEVRNDVDTDLDMDIRSYGGYIVAPPSIHGSGRQYEWEEGFSIYEIDPAPCKPWMIDYLKAITTKSSAPAKEKTLKPSETSITAIKPITDDTYYGILKNGAQQGYRNHTATKLIGHLLGKSIPASEAWEMVSTWNNAKNSPPIDHTELKQTFDSIHKLHSSSQKQPSGEKKKPEIKIESYIDTPEKIISAFNDNYVRVPVAIDHQLRILEKEMNGGLVGGRLYVLGGIPSSGKTALVNNIADNICLNDYPVLFFSYDDGADELRYRTYARFSGFGIEDFNKNTLKRSDVEAIANSDRVRVIRSLKYVVPDLMNTEDWPKLIDQVIQKHSKPPVIIADYLRKLRTNNHQADERIRVDEILSCLTEMAKTYNTPILVISELARDSYKSGQRLSMASFKESGSIEYEASWLGILAAVEENATGFSLKQDWEKIIQQDGNVDLIVFKAKRGVGSRGKIALKMHTDNMAFRDRVENHSTDTIRKLKSSKYA